MLSRDRLSSLGTGLWLPLALGTPVLILLQALVLGDVWFSFKSAKVLLAFFSLLLLVFNARSLAPDDERLGLSLLATALIGISLISIMSFSLPREGAYNSFSAFFYSLSLLVVFPGLVLLNYRKVSRRVVDAVTAAAMALVVVMDVFGVAQFLTNSYLIPERLISVLVESGGMKFDMIHGHVRALSFMKSPLEFGMLNVFLAIYSFWRFSGARDGRSRYLCLCLLAIVSVISTISRTAMLMLVSGLLISGMIRFYRVLFFYLRGWRGAALMAGIAAWLISGGGVLRGSGLFPHVDLTNLFIRLNNWANLPGSIAAPINLLFGTGRIQNGNYGAYHSIVVDNMYISQVVTVGVVGFVVFLCFLGAVLWRAVSVFGVKDGSHKEFQSAAICFYVAFLVGGMGENLTHLLFYPVYILLQAETL